MEYPSRECKYDIEEPEGKHVQSNIQGECPAAEISRESHICRTSHRKPKRVVQNEKNGHNNPNDVTTIMMKIMMKKNSIKETIKGALWVCCS